MGTAPSNDSNEKEEDSVISKLSPCFPPAIYSLKIGEQPAVYDNSVDAFQALEHQAAATKNLAEKKRLAQEGIALFKKLESKGKLESEGINSRDLAESIVDAGCSARNFDFAKLGV